MNPERVTQLLTLVGLIAMMLSMGLKVSFEDVTVSFRKPRFVMVGVLVNFVIVPAVTMGLLKLFDPHPLVATGFLILAICPGAPVGPPFAAIAKGDTACAVGLMVILSALSVILSPVLLGMLLEGLLPAGDVKIDYLAIVETLFAAQLVPLFIGLAIHHRAPRLTSQIANPVGILANLLLLIVVVLVIIREFPTLSLIRPRGWMGMFLLLGASLAVGWLCGGPGRSTKKTLAITTASRNAGVALVIVSSNFAGTPAMTAVVAYSLVSIFGSLGFAFLFALAQNQPANAEPH